MMNKGLEIETEIGNLADQLECGNCGNLQSLKSCPVCNVENQKGTPPAALATEKHEYYGSMDEKNLGHGLSPGEICDYLDRLRSQDPNEEEQ